MANLSQIQVGGTTYDICDTTARDSISQVIPTIIKGSTSIAGTASGTRLYSSDIVEIPLGIGILTASLIIPPVASGTRNVYWGVEASYDDGNTWFNPEDNRLGFTTNEGSGTYPHLITGIIQIDPSTAVNGYKWYRFFRQCSSVTTNEAATPVYYAILHFSTL